MTEPERLLPRHVAIIMDGNGRWARERRWACIRGHRAGVQAVREVATTCAELGVGQLTLYAFSTENWKRPEREVSLLFTLLKRFLKAERKTIMSNRIVLTSLGDIDALPADVVAELRKLEAQSAGNGGMVLRLALNYGSRAEIASAARTLARQAVAGTISADSIDDAAIERHLGTAGFVDPDLLIRTGGEQRLSNFLLWQASYAELYFTDMYWPDFRREHLLAAFDEYTRRERRFGAVGRDPPAAQAR